MLEQRGPDDRRWLSAPFAPPLELRANHRIGLRDVASEETRHRPGDAGTYQRQFSVAGADGDPLRPAQGLNTPTSG